MSKIGEFTRTRTGYSGRIRTLMLDAKLVFVPAARKDAEGAPDFRILINDDKGAEIGAAWKRMGEKAGAYLSLQLDDPVFRHPLRANLFQSNDDSAVFLLHWSRPNKRSGEG